MADIQNDMNKILTLYSHDVRMCDGDRAAFFDLALEQRDHTSVAAENVSESYSYEFCAGSCFRCMVLTYIWIIWRHFRGKRP